MNKHILWIDDSKEHREAGIRMLSKINGIKVTTSWNSDEAKEILNSNKTDCIITDILRRNSDRTISKDDGYNFFKQFIRMNFPKLPVIFHTKNLPSTFNIDKYSQYLSKWEPEAKKEIELERRISETIILYECPADYNIWKKIEKRLVIVQSTFLKNIKDLNEIWNMNPNDFECLVAELLKKMNFNVLWIPGGKDQGIDIIASSDDCDYLIDVKRYSPKNPITVELVRQVYGIAQNINSWNRNKTFRGGIITSSRFTADALIFKQSLRERPLLKDFNWLETKLKRYAPNLSKSNW